MTTDTDLYHKRLEEAMFDQTGLMLTALRPYELRTVLEVMREYSNLMMSISVRLESGSGWKDKP